jgi:hypothetical protein
VLILTIIAASIPAQPRLFLSLDPVDDRPTGSFPGFVVIPVYFLADELPAIDAWTAGLSISDPGYVLLNLEAANTQQPVAEVFGDFIVSLADCSSPAPRQLLMTAQFFYAEGAVSPEDVWICPWNSAPPSSGVAGYSLCTSPESEPFAELGERSCVILQPECNPQIELRMSLGTESAPPGTIARIPLDFQKSILRSTYTCPPLLICWFCTPMGGKWGIRWDTSVASFETFEVDEAFAAAYYGAQVTTTTTGIELRLSEFSPDANPMRDGAIGELLLRVADVPSGSTTPIELEWIELHDGGAAEVIRVSSNGLLTVTERVRLQSMSIGAVKAKY